jgi:hypothetical protein
MIGIEFSMEDVIFISIRGLPEQPYAKPLRASRAKKWYLQGT